MSERDAMLLVEDMLEALRRIQDYVQGKDFSSYLADNRTKDAVLRNITILGEAARRVPNP